MKDRAALGIIEEAEARGLLRPGGTIVEGTARNTGIGHATGYHTVIVIPEISRVKKIDLLRAGRGGSHRAGKAMFHPDNYKHIARQLAEEVGGLLVAIGAFFGVNRLLPVALLERS